MTDPAAGTAADEEAGDRRSRTQVQGAGDICVEEFELQ